MLVLVGESWLVHTLLSSSCDLGGLADGGFRFISAERSDLLGDIELIDPVAELYRFVELIANVTHEVSPFDGANVRMVPPIRRSAFMVLASAALLILSVEHVLFQY